jgi:hypothetical protein
MGPYLKNLKQMQFSTKMVPLPNTLLQKEIFNSSFLIILALKMEQPWVAVC